MDIYSAFINKKQGGVASVAVKVIEEQLTLGGSDRYTAVTDDKRVLFSGVDNDKLPHFGHPVIYHEKCYADARPYLKANGGVRNSLDYGFLRKRAIVTLSQFENPDLFEHVIIPLCAVFGEWISSTLVQRFGGSVGDGVKYNVIAASYYAKLILEHTAQSQEYKKLCLQSSHGYVEYPPVKRLEMGHDALAGLILKVTGTRGIGVPASFTNTLLDDGLLEGLAKSDGDVLGLADLIKAYSETDLGEFTHATLMRVTSGGTWMGTDAASLSVAALESPIVLSAMIAHAMETPSYKNKTRIGRVCNSLSRKVDLDTVIAITR